MSNKPKPASPVWAMSMPLTTRLVVVWARYSRSEQLPGSLMNKAD